MSVVHAAEFTATWKPAGDESKATATVTRMMYDKEWAYTMEIDDNPHDVGLFAPGFFAAYQFTDAPPGVKGGKRMPLVGSMAIIGGSIGANSAALSFDDLRKIISEGWGISSHSYAHRGRNWGDPPEILTKEELREDLFWSQVLFATELLHGRGPTHFVYPNGYMGYSDALEEMGLISGSRVGGNNKMDLYGPDLKLKDLDRSYLDEGSWTSQWNKSDPMAFFPKDGPPPGTLFIDFTHVIDIKPESENQKRWKMRLETIASRYGADGTDTLWSAPSGDIINYSRAAKVAQTKLEPGKLTVSLPDTLPGTPLTVRLEGIPEGTKIDAKDGTVYQRGTTTWITTPVIGVANSPLPGPKVRRIFAGPAAETITLEKPAKIAAVRVHQNGPASPTQTVKVNLTLPDGTTMPLGEKKQNPQWGSTWWLFSTVPNGPAVLATGFKLNMYKEFKEVEVWAQDE